MYNKKQRIAALIGVVILAALYIATLICAVFNFDGSGRLFQACLFATIAVPILIWIYIYLYGKLADRHTIASFASKEDYEAKQNIGKESVTSSKDSFDK